MKVAFDRSAAGSPIGTSTTTFKADADGTTDADLTHAAVPDEMTRPALRLNGATITDAAGRPWDRNNLTLDTAQVVQGDRVDGTLRAPAAPQRVAVISAPQADRTYRRGEHILVDVQFNKGVAVTGAPQLELTIDNAGGSAPRPVLPPRCRPPRPAVAVGAGSTPTTSS